MSPAPTLHRRSGPETARSPPSSAAAGVRSTPVGDSTGSDSDAPVRARALPRARARVRLANLAPRLGDLLITLRARDRETAETPGTATAIRLAPGAVTGAFGVRFEDERGTAVNVVDPLDLPVGTYDLVVADAGDGTVLRRDAVRFGPASYTLAVFGTPGAERVRTFRDKLGVLHPGSARARVVAVAPDVPALDAWLRDGPELATALGYGAGGGHRDVPAGRYELALAAPADPLSADGRRLDDRETLDVSLAADSVTTVFVTDGRHDEPTADAGAPFGPVVAVSEARTPESR